MSDPKFKNIGTPVVKTIEECSELIKACCKAERFGMDNYNPYDQDKILNRDMIIMEIADVREAITCLENYLKKGDKP